MTTSHDSRLTTTGSAGVLARPGCSWHADAFRTQHMYAVSAAVAGVKPNFTATKRPPQRLGELLT